MNKPKYNKMTVYVDKELVKQAKRYASDNDKTLSALIREIVLKEIGIKTK